MNIKTNELQRYKKKGKSGYALPGKKKKGHCHYWQRPFFQNIYVQIRAIRGDYFFTNVFVTAPSSVVTRTKYMPAARSDTLTLVCMGE